MLYLHSWVQAEGEFEASHWDSFELQAQVQILWVWIHFKPDDDVTQEDDARIIQGIYKAHCMAWAILRNGKMETFEI